MTVMGYRDRDVLAAAKERMSLIFDRFEHVEVSVSGGKDSTVIRWLAVEEAARRKREVALFFLDQEAEYESTVELMREWMHDPRITPRWLQVPIKLTNATSHATPWLNAWHDGEPWMREKDPVAVKSIDEPYPDRFYDFFAWRERQAKPSTALVVGLRTRESFNRYRTMAKEPGVYGWCWSTRTAQPGVARVYPIYDWTQGDVWKCITEQQLRYNAAYDRLFAKYGANQSRMRVSNLVHEQAFRCLTDLHEMEPETYERLVARLSGVHAAALYGRERQVYAAGERPRRFPTWSAYREHLVATTPSEYVHRYVKRFAGQPKDEETYRRQCQQILMNDWENNVIVANTRKDRLRAIWWDRL